MSLEAKLKLIENNDFFKDFSPEDIEFLLQNSHSKIFSPKQDVFLQDDTIKNYYMLLSGVVKIYRISADGTEKTYNMIGAGNIIAEIACMLENKSYPVSAIALEECTVLQLDANILRQAVIQRPNITKTMINIMSQRIYRQIDFMETLKYRNSLERLQHFFLSEKGEILGNKKTIQILGSKKNIADKISITPESFSRCLRFFKDNNFIEDTHDAIIIKDIEKLTQYSYSE